MTVRFADTHFRARNIVIGQLFGILTIRRRLPPRRAASSIWEAGIVAASSPYERKHRAAVLLIALGVWIFVDAR